MSHPTKTKINYAVCATVVLAVFGWYISDRREISAAITRVEINQRENTLDLTSRMTKVETNYENIDARLSAIEKKIDKVYAILTDEPEWINKPAE